MIPETLGDSWVPEYWCPQIEIRSLVGRGRGVVAKEADQKKLGKKPWMTPSAVCDFFDKEIPAFGGMTEQAALSRGIVPAPEGRRLFAVRKSPENPFGPGCASLSGECLAGVYFLRFWF